MVAQGHAAAQNHTTLVIAVDLTQSVAVRGPDGRSEFQKNIEGVTKQLALVPADSRVTVVGITDHSFTQPDILLSATIPADAGYFGERLSRARNQLVQGWSTRSAKLEPRYQQTDIIGALMLAGQLFDQDARTGQKILVIYSDMRHRTADLDLESLQTVPRLEKTSTSNLVRADIHDVEVYAFGVDGAGKSMTYWLSLRGFWTVYFRSSGATLKSYAVLRNR